jgi:hypothetical protein
LKILYVDFLYPKSHLRLDVKYINNLTNIATVFVLSPFGRYKNYLSKEVKLIENHSLQIKKGKIKSRFSSLKIMFLSALKAREINPDFIYVSSYETMIFAIGRLFFRKKDKVVLLHHFNIDELTNKIKRSLFKSYASKVEHIVFEDFIKDYLVGNFNVDSNRIHVLPHAITSSSDNVGKNNYSCVGLSNSNDEDIISEIIKIEDEQDLLKKSGCKVILKSKLKEYDNGYLKVIKGFLENEIFEEYIKNSQSIYIPFPKTFRYRMSGTLVDAIANNKILYGSNILLIDKYSKKYSKICIKINNAEDFFKQVLNQDINITNEQNNEFKKFKKDHSNKNIEETFKNIFKINN